MKPDPDLEPVRVVNGNELYVRSSPGAYWFSRTDKGGYFHKAFILGGGFSGESSADHIAQKIWVGYSYELVHRALLELGWHDVDTLYAERRRAAETPKTHADRERALQAEIREALGKIAKSQLDKLWEKNCGGLWLRRGAEPSPDSQDLLDSGLIDDEERIEELENGDEPAGEEVEKYQERWVESQLSGDAEDADAVPGYALALVIDGAWHEGVALIFRTGNSFSGISTWLEGIFASKKEAIAWMEERGWRS